MHYIKKAEREVDSYGVTHFEVRNKKGTHLLLGVDDGGIALYEINNLYFSLF